MDATIYSVFWVQFTQLFLLCNGQGQLCPLTCAQWRDLSNNTRMSTIQSRTLKKKAKNHVTLTRKLPWKSCSTTRLPLFSLNPKILKAFLKTFPTKMKPTKCPTKEKNKARKAIKEPEGEKAKSKSQDCCVTYRVLLISKSRVANVAD